MKTKITDRLIVYVDGACKGNPGPAGIGVVVCNNQGKIVAKIERFLGQMTNNIAEYQALICGLEEALARKAAEVVIRSDSELIVRQLSGRYKIRARHLQPLAEQVQQLKRGFKQVIFQQIPRQQNRQADRLAKGTVKNRSGQSK